MAPSGNDTSTVASLDPRTSFELHFPVFKSSPRLQGSHYMALRKASRTPEYTREYSSGDPVHLVDWKAFARTDQLLLREHRDESSAMVRIYLEATETMLWPTAAVPIPGDRPPTKLEIACRLAYHLAHVHLRMGDLVSIWLIRDDDKKVPHLEFAPRSPSDLISAFDALWQRGFVPEELLHEFRDVPFAERRVDYAWWVGDALSNLDFATITRDARHASMLHTLSYYETVTDWLDNDVSYFDEGRERKEYRGQALKAHQSYELQLQKWRKRLTENCRRDGGNFLGVDERTKIVALQSFLGELMRAEVGA